MGETIKGGELPKSPSASGIVIEGSKTLEEHVAEEEAKELGEVLTPDNVVPYHKFRGRHKDYKELNGSGRVFTRREINVENWESIMGNQGTIEGVMASLLLSGREVTGKEIMNNCIRQIPEVTKKKYSMRSSYILNKTDFGKFITKRREGKGLAYKLVPAAFECKVEELMHFVYKGNKEGRDVILEHHKGLSAYLEPDDDNEQEKEEVKQKDQVENGVVEEKAEAPVQRTFHPIVPSTLGVNVVVSGEIKVIFKFHD